MVPARRGRRRAGTPVPLPDQPSAPSAPIASVAVAASRPLTSPSSALLYAVTMRGEMCLG
jgi:hypothetical protein